MGKYIVFLDSDDILLPKALEQRMKAIEENGGSDYAIGGCRAFVQGESIEQVLAKKRYTYGSFNGDPLKLLLESRYPFIVCTNIYRKDSLIKNSILWDENNKVFQDFQYNLKVLMAGLTYNSVNPFFIDYLYRVGHSDSNITKDFISNDKFQSTFYLIKKTLIELSKRSDYSKRKNEFIGFIVNYYLRLLTAGTEAQSTTVENYCKQNYGYSVILRFKIIGFISKIILRFKYRMDILKLAVLLLFQIKII